VARFGKDLEERNERKRALFEVRMRHNEVGRDDFALDEEKIEIDDARAPFFAANATELDFHGEERVEKCLMTLRVFYKYCGVQIARLRGPDGRRVVDRRPRDNAGDAIDRADGERQRGRAIAEIAAEADDAAIQGLEGSSISGFEIVPL